MDNAVLCWSSFSGSCAALAMTNVNVRHVGGLKRPIWWGQCKSEGAHGGKYTTKWWEGISGAGGKQGGCKTRQGSADLGGLGLKEGKEWQPWPWPNPDFGSQDLPGFRAWHRSIYTFKREEWDWLKPFQRVARNLFVWPCHSLILYFSFKIACGGITAIFEGTFPLAHTPYLSTVLTHYHNVVFKKKKPHAKICDCYNG